MDFYIQIIAYIRHHIIIYTIIIQTKFSILNNSLSYEFVGSKQKIWVVNVQYRDWNYIYGLDASKRIKWFANVGDNLFFVSCLKIKKEIVNVGSNNLFA